MQATGVTANLSVPDIATARDFYTDFLGLSVEGFNLGWVANYQSPNGRATVQLVTRDATDFDLPSTIYDLPFLSEKAKHNILGGTAARLFKLKPRNEKQKENLIKHGNLAA